MISYGQSNFSSGVGVQNIWFYDPSTGAVINESGDIYVLARVQNVTLTYVHIYGAGNLFPEDYFGFKDTTSITDEVGWLDFSIGEHNLAISNDFNGPDPSEIELGYSGKIAGYDAAIGFEAENDELGFPVGRDLD